MGHRFNKSYDAENLARVAFPLGGIGAGMVCFEGAGALSHLSVRHHPQIYNEPLVFAALRVAGKGVRLLEGPVPEWKLFFPWDGTHRGSSGNGGAGRTYGLPRYGGARFEPRFPFARLELREPGWPDVTITAWSPFTPPDGDGSSLPVAALEYEIANAGTAPLDMTFSYHARNFMAVDQQIGPQAVAFSGSAVTAIPGGFVLRQAGSAERPWDEGAFAFFAPMDGARSSCAWFRGGWFDPLTILWKEIEEGGPRASEPLTEGDPSPGGSLAVDLRLEPGARRTLRLLMCWYVPRSDLRSGRGVDDDKKPPGTHTPWYAGRFGGVEAVADEWKGRYEELRGASAAFADCFFDTTLPPAVVEAVAANLTILKSPTVLRQADGRIWAWEGCCDSEGCCPGSCTHVWNYAQAMAHLFPALERTLRQTGLHEAQSADGRQAFRAPLPIRQVQHDMVPASDGQLGGIMQAYREWRVSGDKSWLAAEWPFIRRGIDYCIAAWDPDKQGLLIEPHHNTYDIDFWGPDGMCGSFYLGALKAAAAMGRALGEDVGEYDRLYKAGRAALERDLYDGEYFVQEVRWRGARAGSPAEYRTHRGTGYKSAESLALLEKEGPKYQYGAGCLSDGVLGAWMAEVCGVGEVLDPAKVASHLEAVFRYNFRPDLRNHSNPQRPTYAVGAEGGLLLGTWPKGGEPALPFVYSNEVWTGIEYQAASHMMLMGRVDDGLKVVEAARGRYDGRVRNPFNEYECGHWYARAMAAYALIQGLTGLRYDAVDRTLTIAPRIAGDFRAFVSTATGLATAGVRGGKPFVEVRSGRIEVARIDYRPLGAAAAAR
jgi:uncharacterized protein (DUF608 family)